MASSSSPSQQQLLRDGHYVNILLGNPAPTASLTSLLPPHCGRQVKKMTPSTSPPPPPPTTTTSSEDKLVVGLAAFNAFLQANVTGPVLEGARKVEGVFVAAAAATAKHHEKKKNRNALLSALRRACARSLDVDGVSVYPYIPSIELFCLARYIFAECFGPDEQQQLSLERSEDEEGGGESLPWLVLRIHVWHYKLLTQPSLGSGSVFNKQWSDVPSLEAVIERGVERVEKQVLVGGEGGGDAKEQVRFLVEKASVCIMLGQDVKAREALQKTTELNGFVYALSGALGKRTRFQENSTSQLVVLAKSSGEGAAGLGSGEGGKQHPEALALNDDTLLESLEFSKVKGGDEKAAEILPVSLRDISPDEQPQLSPLDQIILLGEATLKDAFSPTDTLTSEEILPFAVRVISDKSTNWQIYTQALLVRSRIEVHRSRTVERGVLQMQAVVDQVIVDTTAETTSTEEAQDETEVKDDIPVIRITVDGEDTSKDLTHNNKPTSFFPVAPAAETAPAHVRLRYIHALSTPPRWHLESELAYSWAGVGSLVSALEIFKRLRLWAEVALCLASNAAHGDEDEDGRGSGGEEKARAVLRWRLFRRTGSVAPSSSEQQAEAVEDDADEDVDISDLKDADWRGPERSPPPPNAPRLFCILGEIENDAGHYDRAWEISNHRFSRAQRSLAEHYLKQKELLKAKEAYLKAVAVNRLSSEMWGRLGDINLRLGEFSDAAEAYGRAIASANSADGGEDARTWSNLGSALYSLYVERVKELKKEKEARRELGEEEKKAEVAVAADDEEEVADEDALAAKVSPQRDPATLLSQSLAAYKRGASLTHDNWRIWDNVLTLASRLRPPAVTEMLFSLRKIITIRQNEDALDLDVLRLLLNECVLSQEKTAGRSTTGVYEPPRGSNERAVCEILETLVVPLITARSELWELIARERVWKRDYAGAVDAAEKAWRAAIGSASGGLLHSTSPSSLGVGSAGPNSEVKAQNWLEDKEAWQTVVERTDELVSILENYGEEIPEIGARWKGKARSAVRSVLGKAKESWEGSAEWEKLQELLAGLR